MKKGCLKKFTTVRDQLRREIGEGRYGAENPFPSETALTRRFGVSRATVVRALRELQTMGLLSRSQGAGTRLTEAARHATGRIALIIHGSGYCEIFSPIARAVSHLCIKNGYTLLFSDISFADNRQRVVRVIDQVRKYVKDRIDGVIFQPIELIPDADGVNRRIVSFFREAGIPLVLIDSDIVQAPDRSDCDLAAVNHFDAGRRLAAYLRETGARRIAYLAQKDRAPCVIARCRGVQTGSAGLPLAGKILYSEPDDAVRIRRFVMRERPDAIACYNDRQAAVLIQTLAGLGFKVPDDIAVVGFDDVNFAVLSTPRLTTMHQPCDELSTLAFDMLLDRIRKPGAPVRETFLTAPLVVRESTKPIALKRSSRPSRKRNTP